MNNKRKLIAIALACAMLAGTVGATAAIPGSDSPFGITVSAADIVDSGKCGENVTYTLDSEGTLTISGTGMMDNYEYSDSPFFSKSDIKKVIIEDGVTSIGNDAFDCCASLTSITIPDSVTSIGWSAFSYCTSLTDITIPDSVTSIENSVFYNCSSLVSITIPDSVTNIEGQVFWGCTSLKSITIPDSVTSIGEMVFVSCTSLEEINVDDNNTVYSSQDGVLFDKNKEEIICFPGEISRTEYIIPEGVTKIGDYAFYECNSLTSVTFPDSVTSIGYGAFYRCTSLTDIEIPDSVTSIGSGAFDETAWYNDQPDGVVYIGKIVYNYKGEMPENTEIMLKDDTTVISNGAFQGCSTLTGITIPDGVTTIGEWAFEDCSSLMSVTVPESVTSIGHLALGFYYSEDPDHMGYVQLPGFTIKGYKGSAAEHYAKMRQVEFIALDETDNKSGSLGENVTYTIDSEGTVIISGTGNTDDYRWNDSPFDNDPDIKKVIIEDGVTGIGMSTFFGCSSLSEITIPDTVTSIGDHAFEYCTSLTSITIPDGVTSLGDYTFNGCASLLNAEIPDGVTSIGWGVFESCNCLTSITVPDSVTSIGEEAFGYYFDDDSYETKKLPDFTITGYPGSEAERYAKHNGFEFIALGDTDIVDSGSCGENVTYTLDSEGTLTITGTGDMYNYEAGESPFLDNTDIKRIVIEEGVTSIGSCAFMKCSELTSVSLPDSATSIGFGAFDECTSLTAINIPDGMTTIGTDAFCDCTSLTGVTLPDSVTSISGHALGYYFNSDSNEYVKLPGFTITAHSGTEAERYAKDMKIEFIPIVEPVILLGDVNGDGSVDIADALYIARADANLVPVSTDLVDIADVNGDGHADIADALMIARYDAQLITKLG